MLKYDLPAYFNVFAFCCKGLRVEQNLFFAFFTFFSVDQTLYNAMTGISYTDADGL